MTKAKSPKKASLPLKDRAIRAALDLAAERGWAETALQDIAKACKCSLADLYKVFRDRNEILIAYADQVDQMVADRVSVDDDSSERDRLFDVLMERFDILGDDRDAVLSILLSCRTDPKQALDGLPHLGRSMMVMLEVAEIPTEGPCGMVRALGLSGVYLYALKAWMDDESADLSKTMAALDRGLGRVESLAALLSL